MIWIGSHPDGSLDTSIFYWDGDAADIDFARVSAPGWYVKVNGMTDGPYQEMEDARLALTKWLKKQTTLTSMNV